MNGHQPVVHSERNARAEQLQFLRFLAFFCVYVGHAEIWLFFPFPAANCATTAVAFFFLLSGFVAGYSAYGKEIRLTARTYGKNLWKKICRIYPLYFFAMLVFALGTDVLTKYVVGDLDDASVQLLKNFLMIQSWWQEGNMSYNGLSWYISTLMFLNLFSLPAVWLFGKVNQHPKRVFLLSGSIVSLLFATAVYCYLTRTWDVGYWHYVFPPARLGEFLSGIALGYLVSVIRQAWKSFRFEKWIFTLLEVAALVLWFRSMYVFGSPWRVHILNWLIPNFVLITVFAFGKGWVSQLFRLRPLIRLGDISFECYLVHNIFVKNVTWNNAFLGDTQTGKIVGFFFCLLMSICIGLYLNKPAREKR